MRYIWANLGICGVILTSVLGASVECEERLWNGETGDIAAHSNSEQSLKLIYFLWSLHCTELQYTVSVLGRDEGYTVKYNPLPEGVPEGKAGGNS